MKTSKSTKAILIALLSISNLYGCDVNNYDLDNECQPGETLCTNGVFYLCKEDRSADFAYWDAEYKCYDACDPNGKKCKNEKCVADVDNEDNGACKHTKTCVNGYNADGSCKCLSICNDSCETDGNCKNMQPTCTKDESKCVEGFVYKCTEDEVNNLIWQLTHQCIAGCEENQCKPAKCIEGVDHDVDGSCLCNPNCIYGCMADGSCRHPDFCVKENDKYKPDGSCKCLDKCNNGCYHDGSCKLDNYEIIATPNTLEIFSSETQSFTVKYIKNGTQEEDNNVIIASSMDDSCIKVLSNINTGIHIKAVSLNPCATQIKLEDLSHKADNAYVTVKVLSNDANQNHLHDKYEIAPNQGNDCRKHSDCDTEPGKGDGFCDSLIGFKCSTKCTSDEQCVQSDEEYAKGKKFNFICRSDGRCTPDAFVTVWEITKNDNNLELKLILGENANVNIDWGDGRSTHHSSTNKYYDISNVYQQPGTYTVSITGFIDGWSLNHPLNGLGKGLKKVLAFGPVIFDNGAFKDTQDIMLNAIDIPNPDNLKTLAHAFENSNYNGKDLNKWDTSNVIDMSSAFQKTSDFNQPLDRWNTSNVTNMNSMFNTANAFNKPINNWDTSKVTDMSSMFYYAINFNQPLNDWNVENVTKMESMFCNASSFNQNLDKWTPINVTTMARMFATTAEFNGKLGDWKTEKLEDTSYMFWGAIRFNQPINFVTKNVRNMSNMFDMSTIEDVVPAFNNTFGENWDTSNVTDMSYMFYGARAFNQDIGNWDTSKVENMDSMFEHATSFNGDIGNWDTRNVKNMSNMFDDAAAFNQDLNWNTSKATNMNSIFNNASTYNGKFGEKWDTSKVTSMLAMFWGAKSFNQDISNWDTSKVTNMRYMFNGAKSFDQDLSGWEFDQNTDFVGMFEDTAMVKVENGAVTKPSSTSDNLCKIYHKIHQSKSDITLNTLLGNSFAEQIQTICSE